MIFNSRAFARLTFFLFLESYPFSTFLHTSLNYLKAFNHLCFNMLSKSGTFARLPNFLLGSYSLSPLTSRYILDLSLPLNLRASDTRLEPRVALHLVILLPASFFSPWGRKSSAIIYFLDTHAILVVTLPSGIPATWFTWHFRRVLFTLRHRYLLFWYPHNLHGLSTRKYLTDCFAASQTLLDFLCESLYKNYGHQSFMI